MEEKKKQVIIPYSTIEKVIDMIDTIKNLEEWEQIKKYIDDNILEIISINNNYFKRHNKTLNEMTKL